VSHPLASAPLVKHPFALKSAATLPVQPAGTRIVADHLVIPSLDVNALVRTTSIVDHELVIPATCTTWRVGRKANAGTTIVAGHVNWWAKALVHWGPRNIAPGHGVPGQSVGVVSVWSVVSLRAVLKKDLPSAVRERRSPSTDTGHLRGAFDAATHQYADNVLATAVPAQTRAMKIATRTNVAGNKP